MTKLMHKKSGQVRTKSEDGNATIFTRDTSPYYYCQVKAPDTGAWHQKSTKTTDPVEALRIAEKWHNKMCNLQDLGYCSTPTQFSKVCDHYLKQLVKEQALYERTGGEEGRNPSDMKNFRMNLEQYISPYFGNKSVDAVSDVDVQSFFDWLRTYWTEGPGKDVEFTEYECLGKTVKRPVLHEEASDSTVTRLGMILNDVFKTAIQHRFIDVAKAPITKLPKRSRRKTSMGKMQPKPTFTVAQYQKMLDYLPGWCLKASLTSPASGIPKC